MKRGQVFYGVVSADGELIVVDGRPWCLTTYKPAAESAIVSTHRDGRNGHLVQAKGPLSIKKFKVVEA